MMSGEFNRSPTWARSGLLAHPYNPWAGAGTLAQPVDGLETGVDPTRGADPRGPASQSAAPSFAIQASAKGSAAPARRPPYAQPHSHEHSFTTIVNPALRHGDPR